MRVTDEDGREIKIGNIVEMPDPDNNYGDIHLCSFIGRVISLPDDSDYELITVKDQDDDCFDIEPARVRIAGE